MKTEVLTADFSEIYKLYHDGKLTNYKDVPFRIKEKQEALQYIENVVNYLTGTPWKGQVFRSQRKFFKIPNTDLWNAEQQKEFLEQILAELSLSSGEYVVAVDVVLGKKIGEKTEVVYLLGGSKERGKYHNWNLIFPYHKKYPRYTISHSISQVWVGFDAHCPLPQNPCPYPCTNPCGNANWYDYYFYAVDSVYQYAVNLLYSPVNVPAATYFINVTSPWPPYQYHNNSLCLISRDSIQSWINHGIAYATYVDDNIPNRNFIGADLWYEAGICGCTCSKHKIIYVDLYSGTPAQGSPIP